MAQTAAREAVTTAVGSGESEETSQALARLLGLSIPSNSQIRSIANLANLDSSRIAMTPVPVASWYNVIQQAMKDGRLATLLRITGEQIGDPAIAQLFELIP